MRALIVILLVVLSLPAVAEGATVASADRGGAQRYVTFTANPGESNDVAVAISDAGVELTDRSAAVTAGEGCVQTAAATVACPRTNAMREQRGLLRS